MSLHRASSNVETINAGATAVENSRPHRERRQRLWIHFAVALALLFSSSISSRAQESDCSSCKNSKAWVTVGFYAKACARYWYDIKIEGNIVSTGDGVCTADAWTSADRILVDLKPDVTYRFSVDGGETCAAHFNFYDIPEGYKLEVNGRETTTIDTFSNRAYGGNGTWEVVVKEKCPPRGRGPSGHPSGPDLGSVLWSVGLGSLFDGRSAGSISIREEQLTATSYTPDALVYSPPARTTEVDVTRSADGNHRQIKVPESLADILVVNATEYDIRFYRTADVGSKDASGLYQLSGQPYVTYKIKNPDPTTTSRLQILKIENGQTTDTSEYTWDALIDSWTLNRGNGARIETKTVSYPTPTSRTETFTVKDNSGQTVYKTSRTYHTYSFGEELLQEVVDPDGAALTTTYTYYDNPDEIRWHKIKSIVYADGSWVKYDYDESGNLMLALSPWKDLPLESATEDNSRATRYTYSNFDGIETSFTPHLLSSVIEKVNGTIVRKTTFTRTATNINGNPAVVENQTAYASATNSQTTLTTTFHSTAAPHLADRVAAIEHPDGRKDSYTYEKGSFVSNADPSLSQFTPDANGRAERETVVHGTSVSPAGVAFKSTKETTVRDQLGHQVLAETHVYNGADYERIGWAAFGYDDRGHVVQTAHHNGLLSSSVWNGEFKVSELDEMGVEIAYTYDSLKRVRTVTRKGIAAGGGFPAQPDIVTTYTYDADGRILNETVASGGLSLSRSSTYDVAGRIKTEINRAGLMTTYAYEDGGRKQTVTSPGGVTQVVDSYLDGQTRSMTGTAVIVRNYDYGVNTDGTQYTQTFVGSSGLSSPRWTRMTTDWLGRTIKVEAPGFTGTTLTRTSTYNNKGQLQSETVTAGTSRLMADKLYEYDELGNQSRAGFDLDASGTLTTLSNDRISEAIVAFEKSGNDWFGVATMKTYLANGSDTSATQAQRERLTNFQASGTAKTFSENFIIDVGGNSLRTTSTVDRAAKKITTTTDTPSSNVDAISITVNGLLQSVTPPTPQSATTYTYDALGRPSGLNDPFTGTVTKAYDPATGRLMSESNATQSTSYEYYPSSHTSAGRLKSQTNSAGRKVYFNYNTRGQLIQTWGETVYPLQYVYDAYGQKTEMHTFRGGQNWTSNAWPTSLAGTPDITRWTYHEPTGLMQSKQDAAAKQVSYAYDTLGRLSTRTWARNAGTGSAVITTYSYDPNTSEMLGIDYSDTTPDVSFIYDRAGRQTTIADAAGTHTRTYNPNGDLQTDQIAGGILDLVQVSVSYDNHLRRQFLQASRGANVLLSQTYNYDATSRLETITSGGQTATYGYHPASGVLNTTTFTSGTAINRSHDPLGRLQSIATTTPALGTAASYTYTYNNLSQRTRVTREDSSYWSYLYNDRGELTSAKKYWSDNTPAMGQQNEYAFDNTGNRDTVKSGGNALGNLRQSAYTTNSLNQYAQRTVPGSFDVTGTAHSAATVTVNNQPTARRGDYFYSELIVDNSAAPVYLQVDVLGARNNSGAGGEDATAQQGGRVYVPRALETYTYDADGNMTSDGRWAYTWDAENRLVSMETVANAPVEAKSKLEFAYDYIGRRIQKKVYAWNTATSTYQLQSTTSFIYDGWNLVAELDGANALIRSYVWGNNLLSVNGGGNTYHASYDGNDNVTALVKAATGTVSASYEYDPFGQTLKSTGEYASQNPFRFSTKYTDQETGLVYYGQRFYNPQTGRWINRDPSAETGGSNLYNFIANDPVNAVDFMGLWKIDTDWKGRKYQYEAEAVAECDGEKLSRLAYLITGKESDKKYLNHAGEVKEGQKVNVAPLLVQLEKRLRDKVLDAVEALNTTFPQTEEQIAQGTGATVTAGKSNEAERINKYFRRNRKPFGYCDCNVAAILVYAKALVDVLGGSTFNALGYQSSNVPIDQYQGKLSDMLAGDWGYFQNYDDYTDKLTELGLGNGAYQGENFIKIGDDRYFGFPLGVKSESDWLITLRDAYNRPLNKDPMGKQRNDPLPGFDGYIKFIDVPKVGMDAFNYRNRKGGCK
ncbi:MAG TPA: RHS repeat-associated core domain-containing protein [Pyrinomonadaceae bacterium]|jgi:RHS repeat-associated protein